MDPPPSVAEERKPIEDSGSDIVPPSTNEPDSPVKERFAFFEVRGERLKSQVFSRASTLPEGANGRPTPLKNQSDEGVLVLEFVEQEFVPARVHKISVPHTA